MRARLSVALSALALLGSACANVAVPNTTACTVAGKLSAGMICAETLSNKTFDMDLDQTIEFLEPRPDASGELGRAGAVCQSAEDWGRIKTALEEACRLLGKRCSYEAKAIIRLMQR